MEEYFHLLLPVCASHEIGGTITAKAAEETGLKKETPIAGGFFDITACCLSSGVTDTEKLAIVAGTWFISEYLSELSLITQKRGNDAVLSVPPMEVVEGAELGAKGAAMCAAMATGAFSDFAQAAEAMVKVSDRIEPNRGNKGIYEEKFTRYMKAMALACEFAGGEV